MTPHRAGTKVKTRCLRCQREQECWSSAPYCCYCGGHLTHYVEEQRRRELESRARQAAFRRE